MNARAASLLILLPLCGPAVPTLHAQDSSLANAIELMRSDVRANKTQIIGRALALPDSQAKVFWPLYRQFELESAKLTDDRVAVIRDYVAAYNTLTDQQADALVKRVMDLDERRVKLNRDQYHEFVKHLPAKTVAHFFQLNNFLNRVIDLEVTAALPEVK